MNEAELVDLNEIQDFFNRVDRPFVESIGVKDFIGWCNEPCEYIPESSTSDPTYRLGQTICALNELGSDVLDNLRQILNDTDGSEARSKLLDCDELISKLKNNQKTISDTLAKELPENVAFYFALKFRLKEHPDEQGYYHYQFDDSGNTVARIDPFNPFTDNAHDNLNQQWHVLISLLAYFDVAHALSNEQHEYHCLYQHIKDWDKGDLNALELRFSRYVSGTIELQLRPKGKKWQRQPSSAMNEWLKVALCRP